jgi:hypothetical protein
MSKIATMGLTTCLVLVLSGKCLADVAELVPISAVVLPSDGSGNTRVLLKFDLSSLRKGPNRQVDSASLNWQLSQIPGARHSQYSAYEVVSDWSLSSISGGGLPLTREAAVAEWEFDSKDYERNGGGLVRLDLLPLVKAWMTGSKANFGILMSTPDVPMGSMSNEVSKARLTILYGF